jgi:hypothetical protein
MASSFDLFHKVYACAYYILRMCLGWLAAAPRAISFSFFLAGPSVLYLGFIVYLVINHKHAMKRLRVLIMVVRFAF